MRRRLDVIASEHDNIFAVRGRGTALGFDCHDAGIAEATTRNAFERGLLAERCGPLDQVVRFLPALTIDLGTLTEGLDIFEESLAETVKQRGRAKCWVP